MFDGKMPFALFLFYFLTSGVTGFVLPLTDKATQTRSVLPSSVFRHEATATTREDAPAAKGKLLVLGGTGFLGQTVCRRAVAEGYKVTSLSRRGLPSQSSSSGIDPVDYRQGDARIKTSIDSILQEGGYTGVIHCVGLLLDDASGLGEFNKFVSGSGSLPDSGSTYDTITRETAFNAIDACLEYVDQQKLEQPLPFCFTSAAEAGWPEVTGGEFIENLVPDFLKRYLVAKRAVESKLLGTTPKLRPVVMRPSLIYSMDRPASFAAVGAFFVANAVSVPFVDRPVTVQSLSAAMVAATNDDSVSGVLRYEEIDNLGN